MFPDIEKALAALLASYVSDSAHIGSFTPSVFDGLLFCRVTRFGGGDDGITDHPAVDIDWFHPTRDGAMTPAREAHAFLIGSWHKSGSTLIDLVSGDVGPVERPWPNTNIRRIGGTYTVSARRVLI